jgi:hypothetical protein
MQGGDIENYLSTADFSQKNLHPCGSCRRGVHGIPRKG